MISERRDRLIRTLFYLSLSPITMQPCIAQMTEQESYLGLLPREILSQVVLYCNGESDELFIERLKNDAYPNQRSKSVTLDHEKKIELTKDGILKIKSKQEGSTLSIAIPHDTDSPQASTFKDFLSGTLFNWIRKPKQKKPQKVTRFAVSENKKNLALLIDNTRIDSYTLHDYKAFLHNTFSLKSYFENEGCLGYVYSNGYEETARGYTVAEDCQKESGEKWNYPYHNPVRLLAISHNGQVAFANDHQIFLINMDGLTYRKIHQDTLKHIGPLKISRKNCFLFLRHGNFATIAFNNSGTALGFIYACMVDVLDDRAKIEKIENQYDEHDAQEKILVTLQKKALRRLHNNFQAPDRYFNNLSSSGDFFEQLQQLVPYEIIERLKNLTNPRFVDKNSTVQIVHFREPIVSLETISRIAREKKAIATTDNDLEKNYHCRQLKNLQK